MEKKKFIISNFKHQTKVKAAILFMILISCVLSVAISAAVTTTVLNTTDANRSNCVLYARSRCPSLPTGLNTLQDKKNIINSTSPSVGSVAIINSGYTAGHVAYVTGVSGSTITIEEANWGGARITRRKGTASELNILGYYSPGGSTSNNGNGNGNNTNNKNPEIKYATPSPTTVTAGDSVKVHVKTNSEVTRIEMFNEYGERVDGGFTLARNANGEKEWDTYWKTEKTGSRTLKVRAYSSSKHVDYTLKVTVKAKAAVVKTTITSVSASPSTVVKNKKTVFTAVTSTDVTQVWFYNGQYYWAQGTTYTDSGSKRTWKCDVYPNTAGTYTITAKATGNSGTISKSFTLKVTEPASTTKTTITSVSANPSTVVKNKKTVFTAVTSTDVTQVWFYNGQYYWAQGTTYTDSGSKRTWKCDVYPNTAGTYTITAKATGNSGTVSKSFTLKVTGS
jgi:hypothetical protein